MMKKTFLLISLLCILYLQSSAQKENEKYIIETEIKHLPVISQGSTGTCWSFATTSFLESEIFRKGYPETDLSEMYFVYYAYQNKAKKYLESGGESNFGQGGQAHDVLNVLVDFGLVTNETYEGKMIDGNFNHRSLVNELRNEVKSLNSKDAMPNDRNIKSIQPILKKYIGKLPKKFRVDNDKLSPEALRNKLNINPEDYVEITSYSDHPFYQTYALNVPDNWSYDLYYNLPIDELIQIMNHSLKKGYTLCWDGDTSEKTFTHKNGIAYLPEEYKGKVTQELRQETFDDHTTTDDHLMHVVGISRDKEGRKCFYTKNSWGADSNDIGGYLHLSEDYVRLKTIAILVHKDAIPENLSEKLNL